MIRLHLAAACLLAGAVLPVSVASAQAGVETRSIAVRYDDLSLAGTRGRQTLALRIARAVSMVCGSGDARDLAERQAQAACRRAARAGSEAKLAAILNVAGQTTLYAAADPRR